MSADTVYINGNEGDDRIFGGTLGVNETIQGGKGDDQINFAPAIVYANGFDETDGFAFTPSQTYGYGAT